MREGDEGWDEGEETKISENREGGENSKILRVLSREEGDKEQKKG